MAVVDAGARSTRSWRSARSGTSSPPSSATVTDTGRLAMHWHGEKIVDVPPRTAGRTRARSTSARSRDPTEQDALHGRRRPRACRARAPATSCGRPLLRLVGSPEPGRQVLDHRPVRPVRAWATRCWRSPRTPAWSGSTSDDQPAASRVATDGNGRYTKLDPYAGAQLALAEAYRNVAATGARPLAVTNCLNFGSPEDPAVMWQFAEAVRGLADGCQELGTPVTGGNVSLLQPDRRRRDPPDAGGRRARRASTTSPGARRSAFRTDGATIYLLGDTPRGVRRLGVGARRARLPRRPAAGGRPASASGCSADILIAASPRRHDRRRARPVRRRSGPGARRVLPARRRRRPDRAAGRVRPVRRAVHRVGRAGCGRRCRAARSCAVHRHVRRAWAAVHPHRCRGPAGDRAGRDQGQFRVPLRELRAAWSSTLPAQFG